MSCLHGPVAVDDDSSLQAICSDVRSNPCILEEPTIKIKNANDDIACNLDHFERRVREL